MIDTVLTDPATGKILWLDVRNPTGLELQWLQSEFSLHPTWMTDCVQTGHLPKIDRIGTSTLVIVRAHDLGCKEDDRSYRAITRKVAIIIGNRFLITVHRDDMPFLQEIRERYRAEGGNIFLQVALLEIVLAAMNTYLPLLYEAEVSLESFEDRILGEAFCMASWTEIIRTKSRLSIAKRMLLHSLQDVHRFHPSSSSSIPFVQDVREQIETLIFFAESLSEELAGLQNLQISLASHRLNESSNQTNETMRLLTVVSLIFLPMTFLVGVYGMNFEHMPELHWKHGYFAIWLVTIAVGVGMLGWFRYKGWLRAAPTSTPASSVIPESAGPPVRIPLEQDDSDIKAA